MKHSLAGAEAPFVHLSYNHPKRAPATILGACHSYIFRTLALLGKKEGLPELPRTLAVTSRGDRIRTCDLVLPKHPRYQAAPRPAVSPYPMNPRQGLQRLDPLPATALRRPSPVAWSCLILCHLVPS